MKLLLIASIMACLSTFAAEQKAPRYQQIMDADGKVVATLDTKENEIDYKEDPKKVVELLLGQLVNLTNVCNQELDKLRKPIPVVSAKPVEKPKKK